MAAAGHCTLPVAGEPGTSGEPPTRRTKFGAVKGLLLRLAFRRAISCWPSLPAPPATLPVAASKYVRFGR